MRDLPKLTLDLANPQKFGNLAEKIDVDARRTMATDLIELIGVDEGSMSEWMGRTKGYLDEMDGDGPQAGSTDRETEGAGDKPPPSTEMTLSSVIQFSARASAAILGEPDLAKASETGGEPLAAWVSSQLRTKDRRWVLDTDPLAVHMAVTGLAWRKRSFDEDDKVFTTHFIPCTDVIINNNVVAVERAPRITHQFIRYPYEIERSIQRGRWVDYEPVYDDKDPQAPKKFYEVDTWLDLDDDGVEEPWTVVIARDDMQTVVRIRPRWTAKTVAIGDKSLYFNPLRRFYPYHFLPDPRGGFFPMGFGRILDRTQGVADHLLASICDTAETEAENGGVLSSSGSGLPTKIEVKGGRITVIPMDGAPLANRLQMFPVKAVSPGSVAVLEKVMTLGDRLAGTINLLENAPASMTATMAKGIIDTGQQIQSAVHRRVVASMTQEFREFVRMADAYDMLPKDVAGIGADGVEVTADPQLATEMQRSALGGVYMQMLEAAGAGLPFNAQVVAKRFCTVMRLPNPDELIAQPQPAQPTPKEKMDGVLGMMKQRTENMKTTAAVAVQLTQALKNLVDANGGMQANQGNLLQLALLEQAVQNMMQQSTDTGNDINGMAQQPGNPQPDALSASPGGGGGADVLAGVPGGPGNAGQGGGP